MRQKGFTPILILVVFLFIAVVAGAYLLGKNSSLSQILQVPSPTPDLTAGWKEYTSTSLNFSLRYPSQWFVYQEGPIDYPSVRVQNYDPKTAPGRGYDSNADKGKYFLTIERSSEGKGAITVNALIAKLPKNGDLTYYIGDPAGTVKILESKESIINGNPALWRKTTYTDIPEIVSENLYLLDTKGAVLTIHYGLDVESGRKELDQILSTFKFIQ